MRTRLLSKITERAGTGTATLPAPPKRPPPTGDVQTGNPAPPPKENLEQTSEEKRKALDKDQDDRLSKLFSGEDESDPPPPKDPDLAPPKKEDPPKPEDKKEDPPKKDDVAPEEGEEVDFTKLPEGAEKRESLAQQ